MREPVVAYILTTLLAQAEPLLPEMTRWLTAEAQRMLAALGGLWRDPKATGLYRCSKPVSAT